MFKVPGEVKVATRGTLENEVPPVPSGESREINPILIVGGIVAVLIIFIILVLISR
jgi:hypothetical protein